MHQFFCLFDLYNINIFHPNRRNSLVEYGICGCYFFNTIRYMLGSYVPHGVHELKNMTI